jgi:succinate dehydrogenase hydrophobic anchor subunit
MVQSLSAVWLFLVFLLFSFINFFLPVISVKVLLSFFLFCGLPLFAHLSIGLKSVVKDYVHNRESLEFAEFLIVVGCVVQMKVILITAVSVEFIHQFFIYTRLFGY